MTRRSLFPPVGCRAVPVPAACAILVLAALAGGAGPAAAQASDARGFLMINAGTQTASAEFSDTITFSHPLFGPELGSFDTRYRGGGDTLVDLSGGVRIWGRFAVGAGVSQVSHEDEAGITGRLPHPFVFDRLRQIRGTEAGLARQETAVHVQALWVMPADWAVISLFGGPTFFSVTQDLVTDVMFDQTYPYTEATFAGARRRAQSASTTGGHVGADIAVYFSDRVGIGGTVRISRGSVDVDASDGGTVAIDVGGVQMSGGLRLRF